MTSTTIIPDVDRWQPVLEAIADVLGLHLGLMDLEGRPLMRLDVLRSPWNLLTSSSAGFTRYAECLHTLLAEARRQPHAAVHTQVGGLHLYAVPLERAGRPVAFFVAGPCLVGRRGEPDDYMGLAKEFDIRIDQWMEAIQEIRVFSFVGMNAVVSLLQRFGELMLPREPDPRRALVWERLLDTALHTVHAERGSVLVTGPHPQELVIQTARGLSEDIIRSTKIRIGEGISGVAAAERVPLRLNADATPPRLQAALQHPELHDAMVVPLVRGAQLLGVLCVSTARPERLRDDGLSLLQRLTGLAEAALP